MSNNIRFKDSSRTYAVKILLSVFFVVVVIFPLGKMLLYLFQTDIKSVTETDQFKKALANSLISTSVATFISVTLACILAYSVQRTQVRHKTIFSVLLTLPMLVPSVSHGMGLTLLLGTNGILTNFLHTNFVIYGFWGIVLGSVMYSFPVAFLMMSDILNYQDYVPYEVCKVLNIGSVDRFKIVTFPYLRKPLISVIFAVFTMIITDYGVPLMIGGKYITLPVLMYQQVIGLLDFAEGSVIGVVLLFPAVIAFILDSISKERNSFSFIRRDFPKKVSGKVLFLSYAVSIATVICVLLPICSFVVLSIVTKYPVDLSVSMRHILKTLNIGGAQYLGNSLIIEVGTAVIGTVVSYVTAYFVARTKGKTSKYLHLISVMTLAVPGIVLGLSYMLFFKQSFLYGTFALLILVNVVHFFSSPYFLAYNSFSKINPNIEAVGQTLGVGKFQLTLHVFIPQMRGTLTEMFTYYFVNSMMTISAISFLVTAQNKTLSLMINQFQSQMILEGAAFVSLIILVINIFIKYIAYKIRIKQ